jgi:hypothetical protein
MARLDSDVAEVKADTRELRRELRKDASDEQSLPARATCLSDVIQRRPTATNAEIILSVFSGASATVGVAAGLAMIRDKHRAERRFLAVLASEDAARHLRQLGLSVPFAVGERN